MNGNIGSRWSRIWSGLSGSPTVVKSSIPVAPLEQGIGGQRIDGLIGRENYFSINVDEMFLAQSNQYLNTYDPLVFTVCEFTYAGEPKIVPFIVGPSLVADKVKQVPNGISITDTQVAGLYPYVGGKLAFTIVLAQIKRESIGQRILQFVDSLSHAFPVGALIESRIKVAGAVFGAVETLFGLPDTKPLIGHRWEYDDSRIAGIKPGRFALVNADVANNLEKTLRVKEGRLFSVRDGGAPTNFRQSDFVLYDFQSHIRRNDLEFLPFHKIFLDALKNAANPSNESWRLATAALVTQLQAMVTSPDIIWPQAQELMKQYQAKVEETRLLAKALADKHEVLSNRRGDTIARVVPKNVQAERLGELHKLLDLDP